MGPKYQRVRNNKQKFAGIIPPDLLQNGSINAKHTRLQAAVFTQILLKLPFPHLISEQQQFCVSDLTVSTSPQGSFRWKERGLKPLHGDISQKQKHSPRILNTSPKPAPSHNAITF